MKRLRIGGVVVAVVVTLMGACATLGDIPVSLMESETIYISPANRDGVQDWVTFPLTVELPDRSFLTRYEMTVIDESGSIVHSVTIDYPAERSRARRQFASEDAPESVLWDGRNDDGEFVPDGEYTIRVVVRDNRDNAGAAGERQVVVDNSAPTLVLSVAPLFSPDGDGFLEELQVSQTESSVEETWVGSVLDHAGVTVREWMWAGGATGFAWDGTAGDGSPAPEGVYVYSVSATDRAGNTGEFRVTGIGLEREPRRAELSVSRTLFSPNGDGNADSVTLRGSLSKLSNLIRWTVEVRTEAGALARTYNGTGEIPDIVFDGMNDAGSRASDGRYHAVLKAAYAGGQQPAAVTPIFTIDTDPPSSTVSAAARAFSPDGDGRMDTVEIIQTSSFERRWTGTFRAGDGRVVRTETWSGQARDFIWDGTDMSGTVLQDGSYTYNLSAVDEAGNTAVPASVAVRIDTRPVPVRILRSEARISPNGDGVLDSVTLTVLADEPEAIAQWVVSLSDAGGATVGQLAQGRRLPYSFDWDGKLDGRVVDDGSYYPEVEVRTVNGTTARGLGSSVLVDTTGPEIVLDYRPAYFSPDGDGTDDELAISISARDPSSVEFWRTIVLDPAGGVFAEWDGAGWPPIVIRWDGMSGTGELVQAAEDYRVVVSATDGLGNAGSSEVSVPIDILVTRDGNLLRISSIYFQPNTSDFVNINDPELAAGNMETLDRLARVLERYPQYNIRIEGHATHLLYADALAKQNEHFQVLVPLSFARAESIRRALVDRGIPQSRMSIFGHGGLRPVVPHDDELNRWKNRRVEFILERR